LDGEEVALTSIQRGVHADLWERPTQFSSERSTARLIEKGRDLKFNDDRVIEPDCRLTCRFEARSRFRWTRCRISGTATKTALVDTKAGVKIQHSCFRNPLPIGESKRATSRRTGLQVGPADIKQAQLERCRKDECRGSISIPLKAFVRETSLG
jgi:hypothetical protein